MFILVFPTLFLVEKQDLASYDVIVYCNWFQICWHGLNSEGMARTLKAGRTDICPGST